jgi:hypothetical protein
MYWIFKGCHEFQLFFIYLINCLDFLTKKKSGKMPYFRVVGNQLSIKAGGEDGSHLNDIISTMAYLRHQEEYTDLVINSNLCS